MTLITDSLSQYGMAIIYAALTAIAGFLGTQDMKVYEHDNENNTKYRSLTQGD